jgi:hypothetical protein
MKLKAIPFFAYLLIVLNSCQQNKDTYYIDATSGNDNNTGLDKNSAWKTINKVNNYHFKAGDKIFLKRGESWNESLLFPSSGDSLNPITIGAYGNGYAPIITRMNLTK